MTTFDSRVNDTGDIVLEAYAALTAKLDDAIEARLRDAMDRYLVGRRASMFGSARTISTPEGRARVIDEFMTTLKGVLAEAATPVPAKQQWLVVIGYHIELCRAYVADVLERDERDPNIIYITTPNAIAKLNGVTLDDNDEVHFATPIGQSFKDDVEVAIAARRRA